MKETVTKACNLLAAGNVISFPTETVYALAADATNKEAIDKIYALKQRQASNPMAIFVKDIFHASDYVRINANARKLADHFFPGPITLILKKHENSNLPDNLNANLPSLAIRVPDNQFALELLNKYPNPIAATSANISSQKSAINAQMVSEYFLNKIPYIVDGGDCTIGVASTIIDVSNEDYNPVIVRQGSVTKEEIFEVISS